MIPTSQFITMQDGIRLHVRSWGDNDSPALPVVCLPGLTRNGSDFDDPAVMLAKARRVLAIDSRGRGQSDYDAPENYTLAVELGDVLTVLTALGIGPAIFLGTSRGGLLTMLLAGARPTALAGAILVDVGPVVEMQGLMRIKSYVGKMPQPRDFSEAAVILQRANGALFPALDADDWMAFARRTWTQSPNGLVGDYDPRLSETLNELDPAQPLPSLWPAFEALAHVPVMEIRGENSDILSRETVALMLARRPDLLVFEVPGQAHAPVLRDKPTLEAIAAFVTRCDAVRSAGEPG